MDKQPSNIRPPILFVPGGVMPAELSYVYLLSVTGDQIQPIVEA